MRNSDADIAINTLNKLIAQEYEAASAGMRYGNRSLEESASIRYHAYLNARDKIREALADAMDERDALNPFLPQRDELVTQDMHTCDLCGRRVSSPVYAGCMWRMKFQPVRAISLDMYRLFERWLDEQKETEQ